MPHTDLIADIFAAFSAEGTAFPAMTLRGGDALDLDKPVRAAQLRAAFNHLVAQSLAPA